MFKKFLLGILLCTTLKLHSNPISESQQIIIALAQDWSSTTGYLQRFQRSDINQHWSLVGEKIPVSFGKNGLGWGIGLHDTNLASSLGSPDDPHIFEGSRRAPAGVFALNIAFGKAPEADPETQNIKLAYIPITPSVWGVDDIKSPYYNRIKDAQFVTKDWDSAEEMQHYANEGLYEFGVVIEHNYANPIPGKGSCFFIHVHRTPGAPTFGCTAFDRDQVKSIISWLDPEKKPVLVQFPVKIFDALKTQWNLPNFSISQ
jgi:L,D-peptidoglycan transpeptidase YkuD (ErfK/YbiS/YcfS/YnhG family)